MNRKRDIDRLLVVLPVLWFILAIVLLDSAGEIDVGKWGYAALWSVVVGIITFYIRKAPKDEGK